jgi:hypothetical protein
VWWGRGELTKEPAARRSPDTPELELMAGELISTRTQQELAEPIDPD